MLSETSSGHRLCPITAGTPKAAFGAALLAALASTFSHAAFAQMEPLNAAARMTDMAAAAPAAAAAAAAAAVPNPNCTLIVPNHVLTAQGLATPFQLVATDPNGGPCNEANGAQSAFVEAAVFDPANSQISIYHPLVIDKGTKPAVAPVVPALPANAIVALWIGFNGNNLTLAQEPHHAIAADACGQRRRGISRLGRGEFLRRRHGGRGRRLVGLRLRRACRGRTVGGVHGRPIWSGPGDLLSRRS